MPFYLNNTKYLSLYKLYNYLKSKTYFIFKKNGFNFLPYPLPYSLAIEPVNFCNLKCPECPTGTDKLTREKGYMDFELFKKNIDEQKSNLICLILHFQGEPLLHENICDFISYANKNNIYTMFSTNAQLLDSQFDDICKSGLDKLIISLDGLNQETYGKYRQNADISQVYKALSKIKNYKKTQRPQIELQFLVFKHNEHEVKELKTVKSKYNIDKIAIKTAQIYNSPELVPENENYSRYKKENGRLTIKSELKNSCRRMFSSAVITWDGYVVPCCFDKNAEFTMGNIKENSFREVWKSKKYSEFRKKIFTDRKSIKICRNCTENLKQKSIRYI